MEWGEACLSEWVRYARPARHACDVPGKAVVHRAQLGDDVCRPCPPLFRAPSILGMVVVVIKW